MSKKPTVLIIMDGFGMRDANDYNAIAASGVPFISGLMQKYPYTQIKASGMDVGLPDGQMGNSEVGHTNIGAGRIVYQDLTRITKLIKDGEFDKNKTLLEAIDHVKKHGSALHCMGLCSDGGVHSHLDQLYALLKMAKKNGLTKVYIHCFMDGRDVPPSSGIEYIDQLEKELACIGTGAIATVMGRYYAMDRDNRYERVEKAYAAMKGFAEKTAKTAAEAMKQCYDDGITDEFITPTVIVGNGDKPIGVISENDAVVFTNFRPDRAREITRAFIQPDFTGFDRAPYGGGDEGLFYVGYTPYDATFKELPCWHFAFEPEGELKNTLGQYLSDNGLTQLRITETEKYAHVTFFFNGGVEAQSVGEDRELIPSPKVATYDLKPEMSAYEVAEETVKRLESGKYDVIIMNFANCDMVGHTGVMEAATTAATTVDNCVRMVVEKTLDLGGVAMVTADHGNAELMFDAQTSEPFTAHTVNPVPFILVSPEFMRRKLRNDGCLADISPTLLEVMNLRQPIEMTGKSLLL